MTAPPMTVDERERAAMTDLIRRRTTREIHRLTRTADTLRTMSQLLRQMDEHMDDVGLEDASECVQRTEEGPLANSAAQLDLRIGLDVPTR